MCKCLFAFVIALALCSAASAQQGKLSLDIQLIKLGINGSQGSFGPDDVFAAQSNDALEINGLPQSSMRSGRFDFRSRFTPRFAFDFGNAKQGWTAVAWGFRQTARLGSESSSSWNQSSRLEAASIDVAYRTRLRGGFTLYAGIKTAYARMEDSSTTEGGSNKAQTHTSISGGVGPMVGLSYSVEISRLELAVSASKSLLVVRSQGSFQSEYVSQDFGRTNLASITEGSARVSYRVTSRMSLGLGAFFSSWHGVTITNGSMHDSKPLRQGITFGGGLASLDFLF
jgi:opacity protein-like surface antigen